jgi:hypothetical protein
VIVPHPKTSPQHPLIFSTCSRYRIHRSPAIAELGYKSRASPLPYPFTHLATALEAPLPPYTAKKEGKRREEGRKGNKRPRGPKPTPPSELTGEEKGAGHLPLHHRSARHGYRSTPHQLALHHHPITTATSGEPPCLTPSI